MFSLATAKGRFSSIAVVGLALTMAACPTVSDTVDPPVGQGDIDQDLVDDLLADEQSPSASPDDVPSLLARPATPDVVELVFGPCHNSNAEGGNSDGWLMFLLTGAFPVESTLAADVTMEDGVSDTFFATFIEPDRGVVAFPLDYFEQTVTLDQVTVDGEPIVLPDEWETTFTVSPESNCEYLPSFYEEL